MNERVLWNNITLNFSSSPLRSIDTTNGSKNRSFHFYFSSIILSSLSLIRGWTNSDLIYRMLHTLEIIRNCYYHLCRANLSSVPAFHHRIVPSQNDRSIRQSITLILQIDHVAKWLLPKQSRCVTWTTPSDQINDISLVIDETANLFPSFTKTSRHGYGHANYTLSIIDNSRTGVLQRKAIYREFSKYNKIFQN